MENRGLGEWEKVLGQDFVSHVKVLFYLLYSVYSSSKDTVTSSKSAEWSLYIFQ